MSSDKIRPIMATPSGAINTQLGYHMPFDTLYVDFNSEVKGSGSSWEDPLNSLSDIFNDKTVCLCNKSCCKRINVYCRGESKEGGEFSNGNYWGDYCYKLAVYNLTIHISETTDGVVSIFDPGDRILFYNFSYKIDNMSVANYSSSFLYSGIGGDRFLHNIFLGYNIEISCSDSILCEHDIHTRVSYYIDITGEFHDGTITLHLKPSVEFINTDSNSDGYEITYYEGMNPPKIDCVRSKIYNTVFNIYFDYSNGSSYYPSYSDRYLLDFSDSELYNVDFNLNVISEIPVKPIDRSYQHLVYIFNLLKTNSYTKFIDSTIVIDYGTVAQVPRFEGSIDFFGFLFYGYYENTSLNINFPNFSGYFEVDIHKYDPAFSLNETTLDISGVNITGLWIDSSFSVTYKKFDPINGLDAFRYTTSSGEVVNRTGISGNAVEWGFDIINMDSASTGTTVTLKYPNSITTGNGGNGISYTDIDGVTRYIKAGGGGNAYYQCIKSPVPINGGNAGANPYPDPEDISRYERYGACGGGGTAIVHYYNNVTISGKRGKSSLPWECGDDCEEYNIYDEFGVNVPEGVTVVVNYLE